MNTKIFQNSLFVNAAHAVAAATLTATLALSVSVTAQASPYLRQVSNQIDDVRHFLSREGYMLHDTHFDVLNDSKTERFSLYLDSGSEFTIVGVCDADCRDLDLKLYNARGRLVSEDVTDDDYPTVEAYRPGRYTVEVNMYDCDTRDCAYGLAVFSR